MRCRRCRDDGGAILIMAVILMAPMLTIAALALDIGNAYQQRRKAQNSVDSAVFAAGRDLLTDDTLAGVVATAKSYAQQNFGTPAGAWVGCHDDDALLLRPDAAANNNTCISTNQRRNAIRIRLPDSDVPTGFARVIGVENLTVNALAGGELRLRGPGILPFGLPSLAATEAHVCLKTGADGHAPNQPPCDGSTSGNFGWLDIPTHGNAARGTTQDCSPDNSELVVNMAVGADHALGTWATGDPYRSDEAQCPVDTPPPNRLSGQTGNISGVLDAGMIETVTLSAGTTVPGRLANTPYQTRQVRSGDHLDDKPLWEFIDPALAAPDIPPTCERSAIPSKVEMATCIEDFNAGGYTTPLFTVDSDTTDNWYDIELSPRFGYVPQLWQNEWGTGTQPYEIKKFHPIYIQTSYFKCNAGACTGTFDPGEAGDGLPVASNKALEAMTALLVPEAALPYSVQTKGPSDLGNVELVLTD